MKVQAISNHSRQWLVARLQVPRVMKDTYSEKKKCKNSEALYKAGVPEGAYAFSTRMSSVAPAYYTLSQ